MVRRWKEISFYRRGCTGQADARDSIPPNPLPEDRVTCTPTSVEHGHTENFTPVVNMQTGNQIGSCHKEPTEAQRYDEANNIPVHSDPSGAGNMFHKTERKLH